MQIRTILLPTILFCHISYIFAQNLIPNPGFEEYEYCPTESKGFNAIKDWKSNIEEEHDDSDPWYYRDFIHDCEPQVKPFWESVFQQGVINSFYASDPVENYVLNRLIWSRLTESPIKDSLYYIEYSTAPTLVYYPPDEEFISPWCLTRDVGIRLETEEFEEVVDKRTPIQPHFTSGKSVIAQKISNTQQIGNCFKATGDEVFFIFGHFTDEIPNISNPCIGSVQYEWFGGPIFIADNFKLEKIEISLPEDTSVCDKDQLDFSDLTDYYLIPDKQIIWNDGVEGAVRNFDTPGTYVLQMISSCGKTTSTPMDVVIETCLEGAYVPNAFTPNGDQVNDVFAPQFTDDYEIIGVRFIIHDRWGNQVFASESNLRPLWNGLIHGEMGQQDTYLWHLEYTFMQGGEEIESTVSGTVHLIR